MWFLAMCVLIRFDGANVLIGFDQMRFSALTPFMLSCIANHKTNNCISIVLYQPTFVKNVFIIYGLSTKREPIAVKKLKVHLSSVVTFKGRRKGQRNGWYHGMVP